MEKVKVLINCSQGIMLCFCHSSVLFINYEVFWFKMYRLCAGYETSKLYYGCHIMIVGIMDHCGQLWTIMIYVISKTHNLVKFTHNSTITRPIYMSTIVHNWPYFRRWFPKVVTFMDFHWIIIGPIMDIIDYLLHFYGIFMDSQNMNLA